MGGVEEIATGRRETLDEYYETPEKRSPEKMKKREVTVCVRCVV